MTSSDQSAARNKAPSSSSATSTSLSISDVDQQEWILLQGLWNLLLEATESGLPKIEQVPQFLALVRQLGQYKNCKREKTQQLIGNKFQHHLKQESSDRGAGAHSNTLTLPQLLFVLACIEVWCQSNRPLDKALYAGFEALCTDLSIWEKTSTADAADKKSLVQSLNWNILFQNQPPKNGLLEDPEAFFKVIEKGYQSYQTPHQKVLDLLATFFALVVSMLCGTITTIGIYGLLSSFVPIATAYLAAQGVSLVFALALTWTPLVLALTATFIAGAYINYKVYKPSIQALFNDLFDIEPLLLLKGQNEEGCYVPLSTAKKTGLGLIALLAAIVGLVEGTFTYSFLAGLLTTTLMATMLIPVVILSLCTFALMFYAMADTVRNPSSLKDMIQPIKAIAVLFDPEKPDNLKRDVRRLKLAQYLSYGILALFVALALATLIVPTLLVTIPGLATILQVPIGLSHFINWVASLGEFPFVLLTVLSVGKQISQKLRNYIAPCKNTSKSISQSRSLQNDHPSLLETFAFLINAIGNGAETTVSLIEVQTCWPLYGFIGFTAALCSAAVGANAIYSDDDNRQQTEPAAVSSQTMQGTTQSRPYHTFLIWQKEHAPCDAPPVQALVSRDCCYPIL